MKFRSITGEVLGAPGLDAEYRVARSIGVVRVGSAHLFFRAGLKAYALGYGEIRRCYRRVLRVPMKMCCGQGSLDVEHLVLEGDAGELAQIQLPGTRAAVALVELMKEKLPGVDFSAPARAAGEAQA